MNLKFLTLAVWIMMMPVPNFSAGAVEISNVADAVNVAGRQRMYSMRMLRDLVMIGARITYRDPKSDLAKTKKLFTAEQQAIDAYLTDPGLQTEFKEIVALWTQARSIFDHPPVKAQMGAQAKKAFAFTIKLDKFVHDLAQSSGKTSSKVIDMSGRLRAVSQALAALYQLRTWGVPEADSILKGVMKRFHASLDFLKQAPETDAPKQKILSNMEKIYTFFTVMNGSEIMTPALAIKKTDTMLKQAAELTRLYVKSNP